MQYYYWRDLKTGKYYKKSKYKKKEITKKEYYDYRDKTLRKTSNVTQGNDFIFLTIPDFCEFKGEIVPIDYQLTSLVLWLWERKICTYGVDVTSAIDKYAITEERMSPSYVTFEFSKFNKVYNILKDCPHLKVLITKNVPHSNRERTMWLRQPFIKSPKSIVLEKFKRSHISILFFKDGLAELYKFLHLKIPPKGLSFPGK
jgi:hypothetical protein